MSSRYREIRIHPRLISKRSTASFDPRCSLQLTQCLLAGCYYIGYSYHLHLQSPSTYHSHLGSILSLLCFAVTLTVSDDRVFRRAMPFVYEAHLLLPGIGESGNLLMLITWMAISLGWIVTYPSLISQGVLCDYLPEVLTILSVASWVHWTASFVI